MKTGKKTPKSQQDPTSAQGQRLQELEVQKQMGQMITELAQAAHGEAPLEDPINNLYKIQQKINNKMNELDQLNWQYYDKQEKLFLKTFINIMDRMSNELQIYKEKYDNIDQEIDQQPECVELRTKMRFFRDQCLFLNAELKKSDQELSELQAGNEEKQSANKELRGQLLNQLKKEHKYSCRRYSLESKLNSVHPPTNRKQDSNKSFSFQPNPCRTRDNQLTKPTAQTRVRYSTTRMEQSYAIHTKTPDQPRKNGKKICSTTITSKQKGQMDIQLSLIGPLSSGRREKSAREAIKYYH